LLYSTIITVYTFVIIVLYKCYKWLYNMCICKVLEASIDLPGDSILLLTGSSVSGRNPAELNVIQLKRWLACRDAPVTGKKPQLIER